MLLEVCILYNSWFISTFCINIPHRKLHWFYVILSRFIIYPQNTLDWPVKVPPDFRTAGIRFTNVGSSGVLVPMRKESKHEGTAIRCGKPDKTSKHWDWTIQIIKRYRYLLWTIWNLTMRLDNLFVVRFLCFQNYSDHCNWDVHILELSPLRQFVLSRLGLVCPCDCAYPRP
jgi:hypothetical protein